jgi:hypothetical protein
MLGRQAIKCLVRLRVVHCAHESTERGADQHRINQLIAGIQYLQARDDDFAPMRIVMTNVGRRLRSSGAREKGK